MFTKIEKALLPPFVYLDQSKEDTFRLDKLENVFSYLQVEMHRLAFSPPILLSHQLWFTFIRLESSVAIGETSNTVENTYRPADLD